MARRKQAQSGLMDEAERVRSRRERLGISKVDLAKEAGVSRHTLAAVERGEGHTRSTMSRIERALGALEEEAGIHIVPSPPESLVTVEVELPDGRTARVIIQSGADADEVASQVAAIVQKMGRDTDS